MSLAPDPIADPSNWVTDRSTGVDTCIDEPTLTLGALLSRLQDINIDDCDIEPTIYAALPWAEDSVAIVLEEDPVADRAPSAPHLGYLLEVALAQDALVEWSIGHGGQVPTGPEALDAVIAYATMSNCGSNRMSNWGLSGSIVR